MAVVGKLRSIVIRRIEGEDKCNGGIIIPDGVTERPQGGQAVAACPEACDESDKLIPVNLKAGDRVMFGKWSGTEVKIDGEELAIVKEADVIGLLEGTKASRDAD